MSFLESVYYQRGFILPAVYLLFVAGAVYWHSNLRRRWALMITGTIMMLATSFEPPPIRIVSPLNHAMVHPGDEVRVRVEFKPAILGRFYPCADLTLWRCSTCLDGPPGMWVRAEPGSASLRVLTLGIPKDQPPGEFIVSAYATIAGGDRAHVRSESIRLMVK